MSFLVVAYPRPEHDGERVRCATAGEAAETVESFLRRGYLWIHIDNLAALARMRTGLDEHGDALPPLDV